MGFLEGSYFCDLCNKGFDVNDFYHRPCDGRRCPACKQPECGPKMVKTGTNVLSFCVGPISFKDSFCFLPMALSSFSTTFGISELKKGFFPHLFNTNTKTIKNA